MAGLRMMSGERWARAMASEERSSDTVESATAARRASGTLAGGSAARLGDWVASPVTVSNGSEGRSVSPWASWGCVPVCIMTALPHWMFFVLACSSITSSYEQRRAHVRDAMGYAGLAVLFALLIWGRASTFSRIVLGLCIPANLYTLFVVSGRELHAAMGR